MEGILTLQLGGLASQASDEDLGSLFRTLLGARKRDGAVTITRDASIVTIRGPMTIANPAEGQSVAQQLLVTPVPNVLVMNATYSAGLPDLPARRPDVRPITQAAATPPWVWPVVGVAGVAVVGGIVWAVSRKNSSSIRVRSAR